jgi:acyl-coenzyme A synthetase/AMP-(fatty) acid ligase/thioesterase domain-containing protein
MTLSQDTAAHRQVTPFLESDIRTGVAGRFRAVVDGQPDAPAAIDGAQRLTYAGLAARVAAVAEVLAGTGDPAEPVVMACGHDVSGVATLLGGVLSGHPLLVLDPLAPAARLRGFAERLGARVCVTDAAHHRLATEVVVAGGRVLRSPAEAEGPRTAPASFWDRPLEPARAAALGFTSGSTGEPKVVELSHRHLAGDAWAAAAAGDCLRPGDVLAHTLPMAFAAGLNVTLAAALTGAAMALYDVRTSGIAGLAAWIETAGVTVLSVSPAMLRALIASRPDPVSLRRLRSLTLSGEAAHHRDVAAARVLLPPGCTIFHRLGATETGLIAELRLRSDDPVPEGRLPVGLPIGPTQVRLVDETGHPVPPGEPGIVEVTRSWLASGYWHDPVRTGQSFTDHGDGTATFRSSDLGRWGSGGQLHLLGRRDHSVKIRGYLVEPGEVDAVLCAQPDVAEAVTVGLPRLDGVSHRLVAYVVPTSGRPRAAEVRAALRAVLPGYMVPETVVFCEALPRTERGKVDRSALPPPPAPAGDQAPVTDWENVVAQVWARALELEVVPRDADFFELGGDSLTAEALISMIVGELGVPAASVSTSLLAEAPTVAEFARRLRRRRPDRRQATLVPVQPQGSLPPLFVVAGGGGLGVAFTPLARHLGPDQPVYALQAHALERFGVPDWSVRAIVRRHLTTLRSLQPRGPYYLAGHSFGGIVAFEMAQQLLAHGRSVALLAILDSFPPDPALMPPRAALSLPGRLKDAAGLALTGLVPTPGIGQYWRFHRQSQFLAQRYRSHPYPGRTLVLFAESADRGARSQWAPHLSGEWQLRPVAGDHISMLRDPHVEELAGVLRAGMNGARAAAGPSDPALAP